MEKSKRIEYEFLPTVCFQCGKYGHLKQSCPNRISNKHEEGNSNSPEKQSETTNMNVNESTEQSEIFGPWMLVERKSKRKSRDLANSETTLKAKNQEGSRFRVLTDMKRNVGDVRRHAQKENEIRKKKEKSIGEDEVSDSMLVGNNAVKSKEKSALNALGFKNIVKPNLPLNFVGSPSYRPDASRSVGQNILDAAKSKNSLNNHEKHQTLGLNSISQADPKDKLLSTSVHLLQAVQVGTSVTGVTNVGNSHASSSSTENEQQGRAALFTESPGNASKPIIFNTINAPVSCVQEIFPVATMVDVTERLDPQDTHQ